jgi:hypothetical protein
MILKNIKFDHRIDIHMKIILYSLSDHFYFDNEVPIHSTGAIRAMHSIIAQLIIIIKSH